jgi:hypothetical protein
VSMYVGLSTCSGVADWDQAGNTTAPDNRMESKIVVRALTITSPLRLRRLFSGMVLPFSVALQLFPIEIDLA